MALCTYHNFVDAMSQPRRARQLTCWLLDIRRFLEFCLTE
jgi:hypothetical protein